MCCRSQVARFCACSTTFVPVRGGATARGVELVRDGECPPAQSYEFWHALKTLGVKTQLVIYPNEGHQFHQPEHQKDVLIRMIGWFNENLR